MSVKTIESIYALKEIQARNGERGQIVTLLVTIKLL